MAASSPAKALRLDLPTFGAPISDLRTITQQPALVRAGGIFVSVLSRLPRVHHSSLFEDFNLFVGKVDRRLNLPRNLVSSSINTLTLLEKSPGFKRRGLPLKCWQLSRRPPLLELNPTYRYERRAR